MTTEGKRKRDRLVRSATPVRCEPGQWNRELATFLIIHTLSKKNMTWQYRRSCRLLLPRSKRTNGQLKACLLLNNSFFTTGCRGKKSLDWFLASLQFCASPSLYQNKKQKKTTTDDFTQHRKKTPSGPGLCALFAAAEFSVLKSRLCLSLLPFVCKRKVTRNTNI